MNIDEQTSPGPGAGGILHTATIDDLIRELKTRCTAVAVVMIVEDDEGQDRTLTVTLGSSLILLGACAEIHHKLIRRGE